MEHKLTRYEKSLDHDGNISAIFIAVSVTDGTYGVNQEHWLTGDEVALVLADESAIDKIIEQTAIDGVYRLEEENKTRPRAPIVATPETLTAKVIDKQKVSDGLAKKKAEIAAAALEAEKPTEEEKVTP
jgi:isopentenyl phosphate kinase